MNRKRTFTFTVATVISTLVLSTFMTGLMSFFITAINTGELPPNISDWIRAWMMGWAIGTPIVFSLHLYQKEWDCIFQTIQEISSCNLLDRYLLLLFLWGYSSAGRAPALHAGGQEFESP